MLDVQDIPPAIWVRRGRPPAMERAHRHDDLEINIVVRGRLDYLLGGRRISIGPGEIALFWAAFPHRLIDPGEADVCWVHLPLSTVLGWGLGEQEIGTLLRMRPVVVPLQEVPVRVVDLFEVWRTELAGDDAEIALLEAQALVRRVLAGHRRSGAAAGASGGTCGAPQEPEGAAHSGQGAAEHAVAMARYLAAHHRLPVSVSDAAGAVHLSPTYAMGVFKKVLGMTVAEYLTMCRLAEAKRLLLTTDWSAADVAHASGFSSQSSFYVHFKRDVGTSPSGYRRRYDFMSH
ncbi:helix-turn-helix domain-containing protein [Nesterenkonia xinjiangensis]